MGPDRLIRRLSQQITVEEAKAEWKTENATDLTDTADAKTNDPMTSKHLCTSCYLQGINCYMLVASQFGMKEASDFYPMYVSQGRWSRCLQYQQNSGVHILHTTQSDISSNTKEAPEHNQLICAECNEKAH